MACRFAFPYCWATMANCCCAAAAPAGVMLTEYHGRNIDTARTAAPTAETKGPRGTRSSTIALRLSAKARLFSSWGPVIQRANPPNGAIYDAAKASSASPLDCAPPDEDATPSGCCWLVPPPRRMAHLRQVAAGR